MLSTIGGLSSLPMGFPASSVSRPEILSSPKQGDTVQLTQRKVLSDEEAEQVLALVQENIKENPTDMLSVHQGLDYNSVMALLGGM